MADTQRARHDFAPGVVTQTCERLFGIVTDHGADGLEAGKRCLGGLD